MSADKEALALDLQHQGSRVLPVEVTERLDGRETRCPCIDHRLLLSSVAPWPLPNHSWMRRRRLRGSASALPRYVLGVAEASAPFAKMGRGSKTPVRYHHDHLRQFIADSRHVPSVRAAFEG